mgnify:CR=1 FL=1|tara:strand:+ start:51 stop:269 length:219 start_codon:yes stop_codon:yes gene_type:complete
MRVDDRLKISIVFLLGIVVGLYTTYAITPKTDPKENKTATTLIYLNHHIPDVNNFGTNKFYVPLVRIGSGIR